MSLRSHPYLSLVAANLKTSSVWSVPDFKTAHSLRVEGFGFRFRAEGLGFGSLHHPILRNPPFPTPGLALRVQGLEFRVQG